MQKISVCYTKAQFSNIIHGFVMVDVYISETTCCMLDLSEMMQTMGWKMKNNFGFNVTLYLHQAIYIIDVNGNI
jgi:hypothetical protein